MKNYQLTAIAFCASLLTLPTGQWARAMDTDIYLKAQAVSRDDSPNVLIILDNSGSMSEDVGDTRVAYDPTIDYCTSDLDALTGISGANAAKPASCGTIGGRIYYAYDAEPPAIGANQWFSSSKNYCLDSINNTESGLPVKGRYGLQNTKIARFLAGTGWIAFGSASNTNFTYVDCEADGNTNGQAVNDNLYVRAHRNTPYASAGTAFNWSNFTSNAAPTLFTSNYVNFYHNPRLVTPDTRMGVAKSVIKDIVDTNPNVKLGLMVFNRNGDNPTWSNPLPGDDDTDQTLRHGGRMLFKIDTMSSARRTAMKAVVDSLEPETWTPLTETLWEAHQYFGGRSVDYGDNSKIFTVSSLTLSGSTVRARTSVNHLLVDGLLITIYGANESAYNGTFTVTVIDDDEFSYTISGTPTSPATGTITATAYRDTTAESGGRYVSPFNYQCQKSYIILVTDGDPTFDTAANASIATRIGGTCDGSSCLDDLAGWMHDNDVYDGLTGEQKIVTYTIGFGTGDISAEGLALLQRTASRGGGQYYSADNSDQLSSALHGALAQILERNTSFTSPSLSVNAFNRLYNRDEVYFALFKPSNSCSWDGNVKKYTLCTSVDMTAGRCDDLSDILDQTRALVIDSNAKIIDGAWSYWTTSSSNPDGSDVIKGGAGEQVPTAASRVIYTYNGSNTGAYTATDNPVRIEVNASNSFYTAVTADPTILGLPTGSSSTAVDNLINWIRGQDSYDKNFDSSTTDARWRLGDPLHSRPVAVTYGAATSALTGSPDYDDPIIKLFVGTNDGLVRMINNSTGAEEWAFMPKEMHSMQYALAQDTDTTHRYGLDTTPTFYMIDVDKDGIIEPTSGDKVYMYIGMRRGGRNIYAFDVTPSATMTRQTDTVVPKLMWVIEGGSANFTKLGQTWSRPFVTRIRYQCSGSVCNDGDSTTDDSESRVVLMFAGGYDITQDNGIPAGLDTMGNAIYIVDPLTGSRIWWASSDSSANLVLSAMKYSIPSDLLLMDTDGDSNTDRVYVGDTGGQLWRIDLGTQIRVGDNGGSTGYVFADVGCTGGTRTDDCSTTTAQNRRKFFYPPDVAQVKESVYSSSPNYDIVTIGSGDREDPLDLLTTNLTSGSKEAVHNRIYMFRDYDYQTGKPMDTSTTPPSAATRSPITDSSTDMYDATSNAFATATGTALDALIATLKTKKGWYIDLYEPTAVTVPNGLTTTWIGEKVLARTAIFNGVVYITTFTPANDTNALTTCSANEGVAKQYALNVFTAVGEGDFDRDGDKERSSPVGGGIPSEVVIIFRPDGTSGLIGTSGGAASAGGNFTDAPKRTYWFEK